NVKRIIIHPIKSLPGIEVPSAFYSKAGVQYKGWSDRSFILVNERLSYDLMKMPSLALLKLFFHDDELWIESPNNGILKLNPNYDLKSAKIVEFEYFDAKLQTIDCGDEIATWFEKVLDKPGVRLLRHVPEFEYRNGVKLTKKGIVLLKEFPVVFQFYASCLIINDNSVSDLNKRIPSGETVSYRNFRPNILVESKPYSEENWSLVQIADVTMQFICLCQRCMTTTIDPDTAKRSPEPLKTLKEYRCPKNAKGFDRKPNFGSVFGVVNEGQISVGDRIYAKQKFFKMFA
ncbi:hypothetical protein B4U79_01557, partial [Dinothrombium tinctorium]